ncbi:acyltransferase family protein [Micromonosporaceae bacterium Da 78-11]
MTATVTPPPQTTAPVRMAWLDALRGVAAVVVAWYHLSPSVIGARHHAAAHHYIDLGKYGVLLFFLVSGYVIPMSLERHGSPRRFWAGRLFRIYPAYLFAVAVILVLSALDVMDLPGSAPAETATTVLGHATMMQDFLGVRGLVWPFWTLTFEMTFYLLVAGLFVLGLHRLSAWWAAGLALTAALAGAGLPDNLFGATVADRRLTAAVLVVVVGLSLAAYLSGRRAPVVVAGVVGLGFLALPLLNGHPTKWSTSAASWQAVLMLAVMFAGTVVYRLHHRQINRVAGVAALTVVLSCAAVTTWLRTGETEHLLQWTIGSAAVAATFAVAFVLRHRRVPAVLSRLGAASYSIYLLHLVVLYAVVHFLGRRTPTTMDRLGLGIAFAVLTAGLAWISYRYVEKPGQALGNRVLRWLDTRLGPDRARRAPDPSATARNTTQSAVPDTGRIEMSRTSV